MAYGVFYRSYSTFTGREMYMEDLYVTPEYRRQGIASEIVSQIATVTVTCYSLLAYLTSSLWFIDCFQAVSTY